MTTLLYSLDHLSGMLEVLSLGIVVPLSVRQINGLSPEVLSGFRYGLFRASSGQICRNVKEVSHDDLIAKTALAVASLSNDYHAQRIAVVVLSGEGDRYLDAEFFLVHSCISQQVGERGFFHLGLALVKSN